MAVLITSESISYKYVFIDLLEGGGVSIKLICLIPDKLMYKVRGIGVAVKVKTSIFFFIFFIFSFFLTPNLCSSSITNNHNLLNSIFFPRI